VAAFDAVFEYIVCIVGGASADGYRGDPVLTGCLGNARRGFSEAGLEIDLTLVGDHQVRSFKVFANAGCLQYGIDPALHDVPGKCEQASSQPTGSPFPSMSITS
jgi:hypothetical protein